MSDSSTDDEALDGGAGEDLKNLPGGAGDSSADTNKDAPPADSSPAEPNKDDKKPSDIADAVRAALKPKDEDSSTSGDGEGEDLTDPLAPKDGDKPKEGEDELGDPSKEELDSWKPKTRRRFEKLTADNKSLTTKLAETQPLAQKFLAVEAYAKKANLSREDVNTGWEIMRLMKNDPMKAIEALEPIFTQLQIITGRVLPPDIQKDVSEGKITLQRGQELSRLRAGTGISTHNQTQEAQRSEQQRRETAAQQSQQLQNDVAMAITKWGNDWKASDPDYALKQSRVEEAIELELTRAVVLAKEGKPNNLPRSVEEAVKLANTVKARVEKEMRALMPKRNQPINNPTGTGVTNGSKPVAKNMQDVVRLAIGR